MFFSSLTTDVATVLNSSFQVSFSSISSSVVSSVFQLVQSINCSICTILCSFNALSSPLINVSSSGVSANFSAFTAFFELPHFQIFFGLSATQTATALIINKADLTGLTPSANNTAESILVGIINRILGSKQGIQFITIDFIYWGYGVLDGKRVDTVIINLYDILTVTNGYEIQALSTTINPNSY